MFFWLKFFLYAIKAESKANIIWKSLAESQVYICCFILNIIGVRFEDETLWIF